MLSETTRKLDLKSSPMVVPSSMDTQELRGALGAGTCGNAVVRWRADLVASALRGGGGGIQGLSRGRRPECRTSIPRRAPRGQWAEHR